MNKQGLSHYERLLHTPSLQLLREAECCVEPTGEKLNSTEHLQCSMTLQKILSPMITSNNHPQSHNHQSCNTPAINPLYFLCTTRGVEVPAYLVKYLNMY